MTKGKGDLVGTVAAAAVLAAAVATRHADPDAGVVDRGSDEASHEPRTSRSGVVGRVDLWQQRHTVPAVAVASVRRFGDNRSGQLAALIAYYGFFSVFPALLALVTVLGFVLNGNDSLRADIADSALAQFPIVGDTIASTVSTPLTGNPFALTVGLAAALWAGLGAMQAAQDVMNRIWGVTRAQEPKFLAKRLRSLVMLALIGILLATSTAIAQLATVVVDGVLATILLFVLSVAWNSLTFLVAFRVLTVADVSWRDVRPGANAAAIAYTALQVVGGLYVSRVVQGASETYGTFAVVIGLLSWIFLIAQVTVICAELNVVLTRREWPRSLLAS